MNRDNLSGQLHSLPSCIKTNHSTLFTICVVKKSAPQFDPRYTPVSEAEPTSPRLVTSTFKCKKTAGSAGFLTSVRFLEPAFRPFPDLASCRQALEYALMLTDGPAVLVAGSHVGNHFNLARSRAICLASRPWHLRTQPPASVCCEQSENRPSDVLRVNAGVSVRPLANALQKCATTPGGRASAKVLTLVVQTGQEQRQLRAQIDCLIAREAIAHTMQCCKQGCISSIPVAPTETSREIIDPEFRGQPSRIEPHHNSCTKQRSQAPCWRKLSGSGLFSA